MDPVARSANLPIPFPEDSPGGRRATGAVRKTLNTPEDHREVCMDPVARSATLPIPFPRTPREGAVPPAPGARPWHDRGPP